MYLRAFQNMVMAIAGSKSSTYRPGFELGSPGWRAGALHSSRDLDSGNYVRECARLLVSAHDKLITMTCGRFTTQEQITRHTIFHRVKERLSSVRKRKHLFETLNKYYD